MLAVELQQQTVGIPRGALRTTIVTGVTFGGAALGAGIAALIKGAGVETPVDAAVADGFLFVVAVAVLSVAHVVASDARARATVFAPVATAAQVVGDAGSARSSRRRHCFRPRSPRWPLRWRSECRATLAAGRRSRPAPPPVRRCCCSVVPGSRRNGDGRSTSCWPTLLFPKPPLRGPSTSLAEARATKRRPGSTA